MTTVTLDTLLRKLAPAVAYFRELLNTGSIWQRDYRNIKMRAENSSDERFRSLRRAYNHKINGDEIKALTTLRQMTVLTGDAKAWEFVLHYYLISREVTFDIHNVAAFHDALLDFGVDIVHAWYWRIMPRSIKNTACVVYEDSEGFKGRYGYTFVRTNPMHHTVARLKHNNVYLPSARFLSLHEIKEEEVDETVAFVVRKCLLLMRLSITCVPSKNKKLKT